MNTSNTILCSPVETVCVYESAKYVRVAPFWWKAIQKKMTTANTRQRQIMRSFVSAGERVSVASSVLLASFFLSVLANHERRP